MPLQPIRSLVLLVALAGGAAAVAQEEPLLLSEDPSGKLALAGERTLELIGISGRLIVRLGQVGEMRFAARNPDDRKLERPVALWLDGRVLRLTPVESPPDEPLWLEVAVSPELATRIEATDSSIEIVGLQGGARIRGQGLEFTGRMLHSSVEVTASDSNIQLASVGDVSITGKDLAVRIAGAAAVYLDVEDANIRVADING